MTTLVFATNNRHKLDEVQKIAGKDINIVSLADINCYEDIPETADTLEGNALIKAWYVKEHYGFDCFADDTGLEVEALNNAPGVYSARYAGEEKSAEANMNKLLDALKDSTNRNARFRTVIALVLNGKESVFEGAVYGTIIEEKRGNAGFGYDPIFVPQGHSLTFAELGEDIKNTISHRAEAVKKLDLFLSSLNK